MSLTLYYMVKPRGTKARLRAFEVQNPAAGQHHPELICMVERVPELVEGHLGGTVEEHLARPGLRGGFQGRGYMS